MSELGERRVIDNAAKRALLAVLGVDPDSEDIGSFDEAKDAPTRQCALPSSVLDHRCWGMACQLYGLRSARNLGIGDFEDLAAFAGLAAQEGASFVGVNPLHALFLADSSRYSPYSPSTRAFLNPLYIAIDQLEGGPDAMAAARAETPDLFDGLDGDLVDYPAVGRLKRALFRRIHAAHGGQLRDDRDFQRFCADGGETLAGFALFETISERQVEAGLWAGWHSWPEELKNRHSDAVARLATENAELVVFHQWLQFEADRQLARAQARARAAGMPIGLYLDLAVGVAPDGAETWIDPSLTVGAARVGSPPDMFNSQGQDWGLAPLSPKALAERDFKPLRDSFELLTRHAGAVRIDHAMGLARLWWIPEGHGARGGGYVQLSAGRHDRHGGYRVAAEQLPRRRRRPGHRAAGLPPCDGGGAGVVLSRALVRAPRRNRIPGAGRLPAAGAGLRFDPRSADARRLVGRCRHRAARPHRHARRSRDRA